MNRNDVTEPIVTKRIQKKLTWGYARRASSASARNGRRLRCSAR